MQNNLNLPVKLKDSNVNLLPTPTIAQNIEVRKAANEKILQLRDVVKIYKTAAGGFTAINDISLDIYRGEFLGIIGKSGAGKTTLLNMISGVSEISSGEVLYYSNNNYNQMDKTQVISIHTLDENELATWRGLNLGIVYQSFELMPQINLVKNIMLPQDFSGLYQSRTSVDRALELLDIVDLSEHAYKLPAHISGGQKQRVAIARALVNDPPVIIADEPTGNLDTVTAETIFNIFIKLVQEGKTIIMVTHDSNSASRFSRVVYVSDGEVIQVKGNGGFDWEVKGRMPSDANSDRNGNEPRSPRISMTGIDLDDAPTGVLTDEQVGEAVPEDIHNSQIIEEVTKATIKANRDPEAEEDQRPTKPDHAQTTKIFSGIPISVANGPAIVLRDVVKTYENAAGKFTALKGVNLQMDYGQFISIVGKSGSGKSTLLNMLTGIDHPTSGEVIVGGENIYKMSESRRALWRGRNIGIVFQFFQLLPTLTLLENVLLPMDYCNVFSANERRERAMELLNMVGLAEQGHKVPASVSSGQQQSAAIARALATDPAIIVADEPTGNLDSRSAEKILSLFANLANQGKTIMIVTHDPSFTKQTDQTVILSDGEIIDEAIARALPLLNHPQMLQATHRAEKRIYESGATILRQGEQVEYLFMISSGEVDVVLNSPGCGEISLARMGQGQFFGEVELVHSENSIASVRASSRAPVELTLLPKQEFYQLLRGSPPTRSVVEKVAQVRLEENLAQNGECE